MADDTRLRTLSLFSGIGGIDLALRPWCRTVCYCEIDPYAVGVLAKQMATGNLDVAPIWDDVTTLGQSELDAIGPIDCITGGFPCQDISCAGKGVGLEGERSGLFFEIIRLIRLAAPQIIFLENVPAITSRGLGIVLRELADCGHDARWRMLSAADVGAPHKRKRWWCMAYPTGKRIGREERHLSQANGGQRRSLCQQSNGTGSHVSHAPSLGRNARRPEPEGLQWCPELDETGPCELPRAPGDDARYGADTLADADGAGQCAGAGDRQDGRDGQGNNAGWRCALYDAEQQRLQGAVGTECTGVATGRECESVRPDWWAVEPDVGRVAHGIPSRVDRLRCLGNAVVPQQARKAFELLMTEE